MGVYLSQALDPTVSPVLGDGSLEQITHPAAAIGSITPQVEHEGSSSGSFICRAGMNPFWSWSHPAAINSSCTQLHCPSLAAGHTMLYPKGNSFGLEASFPLTQCLCAQISGAWYCSSPPPVKCKEWGTQGMGGLASNIWIISPTKILLKGKPQDMFSGSLPKLT